MIARLSINARASSGTPHTPLPQQLRALQVSLFFSEVVLRSLQSASAVQPPAFLSRGPVVGNDDRSSSDSASCKC